VARLNLSSNTDKAKLLRALAFEIHRKQAPDDVMRDYLDDQMRNGNRREFRAAQDALIAGGFAASLRALDIISDDGAVILNCVVSGGDHRLQSSTLTALAAYLEGQH
jgi:hypothetical protein